MVSKWRSLPSSRQAAAIISIVLILVVPGILFWALHRADSNKPATQTPTAPVLSTQDLQNLPAYALAGNGARMPEWQKGANPKRFANDAIIYLSGYKENPKVYVLHDRIRIYI